jgi:hypothetical protein
MIRGLSLARYDSEEKAGSEVVERDADAQVAQDARGPLIVSAMSINATLSVISRMRLSGRELHFREEVP